MPRGLDGNPNPLGSQLRERVLMRVTDEIQAVGADFICVGIDGPAGTGKSTFADELARLLQEAGRSVIRSTTDSFHNPRSVRYQRGRWSPDGYYYDSHNLEAIVSVLLNPFCSGQPFCTETFDEETDRPLTVPLTRARPGTVLLFDGLFLHRPALRPYWHYSVFLTADRRLAQQSGPADSVSRYVKGWELYLSECDPKELARLVINNDEFTAPVITQ